MTVPTPMPQEQQAWLKQLTSDLIREDIERNGGYERLEERGATKQAVADLARQLAPSPTSQQEQQVQQIQPQKGEAENVIAKLIRYIVEKLRALLGGRETAQQAQGPNTSMPQMMNGNQPPVPQGQQNWSRSAMPEWTAPQSKFGEVAQLDQVAQSYVARAVDEFVRNSEALRAVWDKHDLPALQSLLQDYKLDPLANDNSQRDSDRVNMFEDEDGYVIVDVPDDLENTETYADVINLDEYMSNEAPVAPEQDEIQQGNSAVAVPVNSSIAEAAVIQSANRISAASEQSKRPVSNAVVDPLALAVNSVVPTSVQNKSLSGP